MPDAELIEFSKTLLAVVDDMAAAQAPIAILLAQTWKNPTVNKFP